MYFVSLLYNSVYNITKSKHIFTSSCRNYMYWPLPFYKQKFLTPRENTNWKFIVLTHKTVVSVHVLFSTGCYAVDPTVMFIWLKNLCTFFHINMQTPLQTQLTCTIMDFFCNRVPNVIASYRYPHCGIWLSVPKVWN